VTVMTGISLSDSEKSEALDLLTDVININTVNPPGNEGVLVDYIAKYLYETGVEIQIVPVAANRSNIIDAIKGRKSGDSLVLNGHLDTVPFGDSEQWQTPPDKAVTLDGKVYGRGASDMKSGLCAALFAFKKTAAEKPTPAYDLIFTGTADEETNGAGAEALVNSGILGNAGGIIIGEPTGNDICLASKGALWITVTVKGRAAHGAQPDEGINAIEYAILFAQKIPLVIRVKGHKFLSPSTCAVTGLNGGIKVNMIPDRAVLTIDMRFLPPDDSSSIIERIHTIAKEFEVSCPGLSIEIGILNRREPVDTGENENLVKSFAESISRVTGKNLDFIGVNYFSDASVFRKYKDIPVVLFGPGDNREAHKPNESVKIEDYFTSIVCYRRFLGEYGGRNSEE